MKADTGYHQRSLAQTVFKQLMTGEISLRNYNDLVGDVMAERIEQTQYLGLPVRQAIVQPSSGAAVNTQSSKKASSVPEALLLKRHQMTH